MRAEVDDEANGHHTRKTLSNGSHPSTNGTHTTSPRQNGTLRNGKDVIKPVLSPTYYGHDREEVTRLVIQVLEDIGYRPAAQLVREQSGYELESPLVSSFHTAVLEGDWFMAEQVLMGTDATYAKSKTSRLPLGDEAKRSLMQFLLRQQKYLEQLEEDDTRAALITLRAELIPLGRDTERCQFLGRLLLLRSTEELKKTAEWDGAYGHSREILLAKLASFIAPWAMLPEKRLGKLLQQAKETQIRKCTYHNVSSSPSLYAEHVCDREDFPRHSAGSIHFGFAGEWWQVKFSHDGTKLATCGNGHKVVIWNMTGTKSYRTLNGRDTHYGFGNVAWSPDDTKLVACGQDRTARLFDVETGNLIDLYDDFEEPVSSCAWFSDGQSFLLGTFDKSRSLVRCFLEKRTTVPWPADFRTEDVAMSRDAQWVAAMDDSGQVHVYAVATQTQVWAIRFDPDVRPMSVSFSADSQHLLINKNDDVMELFDVRARRTVQRYTGHKCADCIIRGGFGGPQETFVMAGSEDGTVHVWNRYTGEHLFSQKAHVPRANSVAWSPTDARFWVSCGDDAKIMLWKDRERATEQETNHWVDASELD